MTSPSSNVSQLNAQRRRAVQLRVDGRSLTQIRGETGLSVPTIISAFKAFTEGGWHAVDVGARGRPQGSGRGLTSAQESALALAALYAPPEAVGLPRELWSADLAQRQAATRFGVELHARAMARCLARWGLSLLALRDSAARAPPRRASGGAAACRRRARRPAARRAGCSSRSTRAARSRGCRSRR